MPAQKNRIPFLRPSKRRNEVIGLVVLTAIMILLPFVASPSFLGIAVFAMIFALPAIGLNLLMGLAGQVSLGQAAFFAIGAYAHALLLTRTDAPALLAAAVGVAAPMLLALLVGLPLLRLHGHYLALATLGLGYIVMILARESDFTGRNTGIYGFERPEVFGVVIDNNALFLWFVTPAVLIALAIAMNLTRSRTGRALSALNDSGIAAESLGVPTFKLRLGVFAISAGLAGLGGVFYAYHVSLVSPATAELHLSVEFLLMAVLGGLGSVWGALIGAFVVEWLGEGLRDLIPVLIPGAGGEVQLVGYGIALVVVIIAMPGGVYAFVMALAQKVRNAIALRRPQAEHDPTASAAPTDPTALEVRTATPVARGEIILEVQGLVKRYGGVVAVDDVSFDVRAGTIVGLIGPNGAGKTTCFNMISGALAPTSGDVLLFGHPIAGKHPHIAARLGLTRTFQNLQVFTSTDVRGNVYMGRYLRGRAGFLRSLLGLQDREQRSQFDRADELIRSLGLEDVAHVSAGTLPFGRQRIMEVARALAAEPALLLLDEPMAGLTGIERRRLAELLVLLRDAGLTTILVEHDVAQVLSLADEVIVLDDGALICRGTPDHVRHDPAVIAAYLGDGTPGERDVH
ncbi:branched-chain amino acid ABC transporter ATP-binding protein/permease [Microbacterium sp. 2FI]|uniref:branched-chain amino acid ABC transporter ATP-binding protein/permease n=1 Tax=Microbacterium sp. 2FI TaxID=2502193 RepID=UPI0010FA0982|nr:branched-chain amino acid ABC transporter ATP-binding protein/permease [Microbacterium sp. 2FI]